jgi:outer membrane protein TolC
MLERRPALGGVLATACVLALAASGCSTRSPMRPDAHIRRPLAPPQLAPPPRPAELPQPPTKTPPTGDQQPGRDPTAPLALLEVLASVEAAFPLLYAIEQEREIAAGSRLAAEGQFDPVLRAHGLDQSGTYASSRFGSSIEQATPFGGVTTFAGWRWGTGNFPVYYGERRTADGGEFQAGVTVPLLQDREIDPRRARLRAAQIAERLADPTIGRARLDYFRSAAQAYWAWQAAGAQYRIAEYLLNLATDRQILLDEQFKEKLIAEGVVVLNRRLVADRQGALLATERNLQRSAFRLSLYLRDPDGNPVVASPELLLPNLIDWVPPAPDASRLAADVESAFNLRPELVQFQLEKQRRAVELQLARNQFHPTLNAVVQANQDVGAAKKLFAGIGPFATDRTVAEVGAYFEMPLPLRNARGLARTATAQLAQLLARERYTRDDIAAQVQDAVSELVLTYQRLLRAREELQQANRVLELETEAFRAKRISLVELNLQEIAAAESRAKVVTVLGQYFAAVADYLAAIGLDARAAPGRGAVLPGTEPRPQPILLPPPTKEPPPKP